MVEKRTKVSPHYNLQLSYEDLEQLVWAWLNNNTCSSIITVCNVPQVSVEIEVTENDDKTIHVEHCLIYIDSSIDN